MIPFNRPSIGDHEIARVTEALRSRRVSGDGPFGRRAEELLSELLGGRRTLLTTSCTHALEMAATLLDVGPGDEVIVPSFTFVSTANAFTLRGATPVFVDIRPDTLNLDETLVAKAVGPRTKAIVPVHYAGVGCEMDALAALGVPIVEDNAHGLLGKWRGRPLGTFGLFATQSFHDTKNLTSGEGGALAVGDAAVAERAEILREKGTNRARFFRGQVDKYTWVDVGSSWVASDVLAALLVAQLERREEIQAARARIWRRYERELAPWAEKSGVLLPFVPAHCEQAFHMFHLRMPTLEARTRFIAHLAERGVQAVFHYVPLHLSPMGSRFNARAGDLPVTERVGEQLVRLPFYADLTDDEQARVVDAVKAFV